jgi:hypothetical protein
MATIARDTVPTIARRLLRHAKTKEEHVHALACKLASTHAAPNRMKFDPFGGIDLPLDAAVKFETCDAVKRVQKSEREPAAADSSAANQK